jgi:hypothetical protein
MRRPISSTAGVMLWGGSHDASSLRTTSVRELGVHGSGLFITGMSFACARAESDLVSTVATRYRTGGVVAMLIAGRAVRYRT